MEALAAALREEFAGVTWVAVFGAMRDKDVPAMFDALRGRVQAVHTAAADSPRAMPAGEAAELAAAHLGVPATPHGSVVEALAAARHTGNTSWSRGRCTWWGGESGAGRWIGARGEGGGLGVRG